MSYFARWLRRDWLLLSVLAVGGALRVLLALLTPLLFAPDETGHALYVHEAAHGSFPVNSRDWYWATRTGADEFFQPPLYYAVAGGLYHVLLPWGTGALYGVRLLNVVLGVAVAVVTWHICRAAFPERRRVAVWATAFVSLLPTFIGDSSAINNDVLCTLEVGLGTLILVRALRRGELHWRDAAMLSLALGATLWTKTSGLVLVPAVLATGALLASHHRAALLRAGVAVAVGIGLVLPWWIGRNLRAYGDLLAVGANYPKWSAPFGDKLREAVLSFAETFFAAFGRTYELRPLPIVSWLLGALAVALVLLAAVRGVRSNRRDRDATIVLGVECLAAFASAMVFALDAHQPQGRYMFYALPAIATLIAVGGGELAGRLRSASPPRAGRFAALVAVAYAVATIAIAGRLFSQVEVTHAVGGPGWAQPGVTRDPATWVQSRVVAVTR